MPEYQYDAAISFLASDEPLAVQLCALLEPRIHVFLYSKAQEQLAGTDGEKTFNEVFGQQSRVVVILYRAAWGETPWTRIEQTAIRNRAFDQGYDFALFVPLDDKPSVPPWVPKTRIWIGLSRWGLEGAASVVDARVQELGGEPKSETLEQAAARLEKAGLFAQFRETYHRSYEGMQAARSSAAEVLRLIAQRAEALRISAPGLGIVVKESPNIVAVLATGPALRVQWILQYANSFEGARLEATLWRTHPPLPGVTMFERGSYPMKTLKLHPDVDHSRTFAWALPKGGGADLMSASAAAERVLTWWLEKSAAK